MLVSSAFFGVAFLFIAFRLADVMILREFSGWTASKVSSSTSTLSRQEILDRNGEVIATTLSTASIYANPKVILDAKEAAMTLSKILPHSDYNSLLKKLQTKRGFIWLARHVSPALMHEVTLLGIPGIYAQKEEKRVYPHGSLFSHVLGCCGVDNEGLSGLEKFFDKLLKEASAPLVTSLDLKAQHVVFDELSRAIEHYEALGGNAIVLEIPTGKIVAMVSKPDFDPNTSNDRGGAATFNRNTLGVYECGSVFKILNTAIALETKTATLNTRYDATHPIRVGRFNIKDFKGKNRILDVREAFIYSSNIAHAKMALDIGAKLQQEYLERFGMMKSPTIELPEIGPPLVPKTWRDVTVMTVSYGYGISVSPLQVAIAMSAVLRNGVMKPATLLETPVHSSVRRSSCADGVPVISPKISQNIRDLMRLVMTDGTARSANVPGYDVIGKTGTAYKIQAKGYTENARITSFIGAFPHHAPRYLLLIMLDDPKPVKATKEHKGTYGYATAGWNAAPTAGRMIVRLAPILGVSPVESESSSSLSETSGHLIQVNGTKRG